MQRSLLIIIFGTQLTFANEDLKSRIDKVFEANEKLINRLNIAIKIDNLQTGEEIYGYNQYHLMIPASVTKSFTALAALEFLKPDFTYSTQILFEPTKINLQNQLNGDLYIRFTGDPSLTKDEFKQLISKLSSHKIKKINGDIIIDDFIFDQEYKAKGWSWDDSKFCFAAPISAIVIDKNCFNMKLVAGKSLDTPTELISLDKVYAQIDNQIITNNSECAPELTASADNKYNLTGCLNINSADIQLNIAYQDPRLMIKSLIHELLQLQRIEFSGQVLFQKTPADLNVIYEHKSLPLNVLIHNMMKDSDNISADNFLKTIGAKFYNTQGNFTNGIKAVEAILSPKTKIDFKQMKLFDGSGGSRYNLIAPDQLVALYKFAYSIPYFLNELPISGIDKALETFNIPNLNKKIYAKTGNMSGVSNLSGYIVRSDKQILVFTIMLNGLNDRNTSKMLMEQILEEISK